MREDFLHGMLGIMDVLHDKKDKFTNKEKESFKNDLDLLKIELKND